MEGQCLAHGLKPAVGKVELSGMLGWQKPLSDLFCLEFWLVAPCEAWTRGMLKGFISLGWHLSAGQSGNGGVLLLLHLVPEVMGGPWSPPCPTTLERTFLGCRRWPVIFLPLPWRHSLHRGGWTSAPCHVPRPVEWLLAPSSLHPLQCIHLRSRALRGAFPSARQECLWEGASSMCIIFPLTQGAKPSGSGPRPCWRGGGAGVTVLVYHPDVSGRMGRPQRWRLTPALVAAMPSQGVVGRHQPELFLSSAWGRGMWALLRALQVLPASLHGPATAGHLLPPLLGLAQQGGGSSSPARWN